MAWDCHYVHLAVVQATLLAPDLDLCSLPVEAEEPTISPQLFNFTSATLIRPSKKIEIGISAAIEWKVLLVLLVIFLDCVPRDPLDETRVVSVLALPRLLYAERHHELAIVRVEPIARGEVVLHEVGVDGRIISLQHGLQLEDCEQKC